MSNTQRSLEIGVIRGKNLSYLVILGNTPIKVFYKNSGTS